MYRPCDFGTCSIGECTDFECANDLTDEMPKHEEEEQIDISLQLGD